MKSILLAVVVLSVIQANAESSGGFGYEIFIGVLENVLSNTISSEQNMRLIASKMDRTMSGQSQLIDFTKAIATKMDRSMVGQSQLIDYTKAIATKIDSKMDQLIGHSKTAVSILNQIMEREPSRCPENAANGVYKLKPIYSSIPDFSVYCEDGWIVIHRRFNGSLDFNRMWVPYREGFGDLQGEYWLGLEKMHQITRVGSYELKVVLKSFNNTVKTARYEGFRISSELEQYQLSLNKFVEGGAGDSLLHHNTMKFSTPDRDNDNSALIKSCAVNYKSGWWFDNCGHTNLNANYEKGKEMDTMTWYKFHNNLECLKEARMMIRAMKSYE